MPRSKPKLKTKSGSRAKPAPRSKAPKVKAATSGRERMRAYRERMRAAGFRPVQRWVLDLRNPKVAARIKREIALLDRKSKEEAELNAWSDAALVDLIDSGEWN